jgi:acetyl-CoA carboxylase, biotin carboxylase subunit
VILKASAGGGGRGMRIVREAQDLAQAFRAAQAEAQAAFGVPDIYVEKYVAGPRHIEIQVMADSKGNVVHLGERECSIQRRHQKIIEEAPSLAVGEKLRRRMGRTAVEAAAAVQYTNAGTIEFLLDKEGNYYFMEMNTRIQVEHGVTELVTGRDLVKEQIHIAAGEALSFSQKDVAFSGHALECRINAEDPWNFTPSPGTIRHFFQPGGPGVRVDTFAHEGCEISPYYDSMIAKLMTHGRTRAEAIARMKRSLDVMVVEGIKTNIPLHRKILDDPDFVAGRLDTSFMERFLPQKRAQAAS